jgi:crotonobetainyl-CoA:carnitine CoA-transferase CaiB-like acyl-CoA transferase
MSDQTPRHVLDGYKVLDFSQVIAGPTCTLLMAEMGAEVIKIELAPNGDPSRVGPFIRDGRSGYFVQQNRGKKGMCIDMKHPDGLAIAKDLAKRADVMVQNFAPGVIARMGLGYEVVRELNPALVMCSISAFGQTGPLADSPGFDTLGASYAGIVSMCGEADEAPYFPMVALGDVSTAVHAMGAICAALLGRARTGRGQHLDISLLDTYIHFHEAGIQSHSLSKGAIKPSRAGRHAWYACPAGIFHGRDRYIYIIAALDHQFVSLCRAMGRADLITDPRFQAFAARGKNQQELIAIIEGWLQSMESDDAAMAAMKEYRVPFAPILSVEETMNHPHMRQRGTVRTVHDRILGDFDIPGFPFRFSDYPERLELEAPMLGEHNREILTGILGYPPARVTELEQQGVLRSEPR